MDSVSISDWKSRLLSSWLSHREQTRREIFMIRILCTQASLVAAPGAAQSCDLLSSSVAHGTCI